MKQPTLRDLLYTYAGALGITRHELDGILQPDAGSKPLDAKTAKAIIGQLEKGRKAAGVKFQREYVTVKPPIFFYGRSSADIAREAQEHITKPKPIEPKCIREEKPSAFEIGCKACISRMENDKNFLPCWRKAYAVNTEVVA